MDDYQSVLYHAQHINEQVEYSTNGNSMISCSSCHRGIISSCKDAAFSVANEGWEISDNRHVICNYCVVERRLSA